MCNEVSGLYVMKCNTAPVACLRQQGPRRGDETTSVWVGQRRRVGRCQDQGGAILAERALATTHYDPPANGRSRPYGAVASTGGGVTTERTCSADRGYGCAPHSVVARAAAQHTRRRTRDIGNFRSEHLQCFQLRHCGPYQQQCGWCEIGGARGGSFGKVGCCFLRLPCRVLPCQSEHWLFRRCTVRCGVQLVRRHGTSAGWCCLRHTASELTALQV
jgi:hypothetical protein